MFLGFSFGFLLIFYTQENNLLYHPFLVVWTVAFSVMDFTSTVFRRIIKGNSPFYPDRSHFHHLIMYYTNNIFISLFIISLLSIFLGILGYYLTVYISATMSLFTYIVILSLFIYISTILEKNMIKRF